MTTRYALMVNNDRRSTHDYHSDAIEAALEVIDELKADEYEIDHDNPPFAIGDYWFRSFVLKSAAGRVQRRVKVEVETTE